MMQKVIVILLLSFSINFSVVHAQEKEEPKLTNSVNLVFGLSQLTLNGFNVEANVFYKRLAFDYSHGVSLNLPNSMLVGEEAEQGLAVHIPVTTGFGVGYRLNDWLNIRLEPKWHQYQLFYDGDAQTAANMIGQYTTFTLGVGAYGNFRPFKKQENFLKGFMIVPNVRYWPQVSSTLENNVLTYSNRITEQAEVHQSREIGLANTPFFFNVSIGYALTF